MPVNPRKTQSRPVRSYVIRSGRLTAGQEKALREYWPRYGIEYRQALLDLEACFPRSQPLTVEIGFGMGASLLGMARTQAQNNFIGIEVYRPGVGKLLAGIAEHQIENLKIICHDATEVMAHCFGAESIDRVLILFPDPWPKKRHFKRRLVQPDFVAMLREKLKRGGELHLATDWETYAGHMLEVMEGAPGFTNANGPGQFWTNPERQETKFERRGRRLGHQVWDLLYRKSA